MSVISSTIFHSADMSDINTALVRSLRPAKFVSPCSMSTDGWVVLYTSARSRSVGMYVLTNER